MSMYFQRVLVTLACLVFLACGGTGRGVNSTGSNNVNNGDDVCDVASEEDTAPGATDLSAIDTASADEICAESYDSEQNDDGSFIRVREKQCLGGETRFIVVDHSQDGKAPWKTMLETTRDSTTDYDCEVVDSPFCNKITDWIHLVEVNDIDGNGLVDVHIHDYAHAEEPESCLDVFTWNPRSQTLYHSLQLCNFWWYELAHGRLVVAKGANEYKFAFEVYDWPQPDRRAEPEMVIHVQLREDKYGWHNECWFTDGDRITKRPEDRYWQVYCLRYGKDYCLIEDEHFWDACNDTDDVDK